jgi:hypothetical protein
MGRPWASGTRRFEALPFVAVSSDSENGVVVASRWLSIGEPFSLQGCMRLVHQPAADGAEGPLVEIDQGVLGGMITTHEMWHHRITSFLHRAAWHRAVAWPPGSSS